MKCIKKYLEPEIELIKFNYEDILKSSIEKEITDKDGTVWSLNY